MTKQLNKIVEEKTKQVVFGENILDSATVDSLLEHFFYRYACEDDDKFIFFLQRNMKELKNRYNELLVSESAEYNPLIIDLKQRTVEITNEGSTTDTITKTLSILDNLTKSETGSKTSSVEGTAESTGSSSGSASYSDEHGNTRTDNLTQTNSGQNISRDLHADMPQANVSPSSSIDYDDTISWTYVSDAKDTVGKNDSTIQDTGTVVDDYDASGSSQNTTSTSGTTETSQSGSEASTKSATEERTKSDETEESRERATNGTNSQEESISGRAGHLLSEILRDWERYIKETDAFLWLCKNLEKCFMASLLYGEED